MEKNQTVKDSIPIKPRPGKTLEYICLKVVHYINLHIWNPEMILNVKPVL